MRRPCIPLLLSLILATRAGALELRRVGELRLGKGGFVEWLDPRGWLRMANEWESTPSGGRRVTFVLADARGQALVRLPFDLEAFARSHPALFTGLPNVELVYFDGTKGLLRFDRREPSRKTSYYSVWDPGAQALSEPVPLGGASYRTVDGKQRTERITWLFGPDPAGGRLYFAETTLDDRSPPEQGPLRIRFFRVGFPGLAQDWELDLALPRRARPLQLETYRAFSPDGKRFALAEYADAAAQRGSTPVPPPQVYVVDVERGKVASYAIPRTSHALAFSGDGRHLAVGSFEKGELLRIDLEAGRVDRRTKTQPHLQALATVAGDWLLAMSDHIGAPRSIEVRRWSDLGLQETIAPSRLFPGVAGIHPSGARTTGDGRLLVFPRYAPDGYPDAGDKGIVAFAVGEGAGGAVPDPTALVRSHVERAGLTLYGYHLGQVGNAEGRFAPIVQVGSGEAFVIGTRSELPEDAPYQDGKSHPYAIWVDAGGKVVWERSLRSGKHFLDYQGGSAVATPDGAVIAFVLCYVAPGSGASSRLVKVDRAGKVLWEWTSRDGREARFPERLQLLPSGRVLMQGHLGTSTTPWVGELDARTGRLVRDEAGAAR